MSHAVETDVSPSHAERPIELQEAINKHYGTYRNRKLVSRISEDNYSEEREEEKDQIQEIYNNHIRLSDNLHLNGLQFLNRRSINSRQTSDQPLSSRDSQRLYNVKYFVRTPDAGNNSELKLEDSADFTAINNEFMKSAIYSLNKRSPRKTLFPFIRPLSASRENIIQRVI